MKRMLVGAVAGLLCFGAAQISAASPTSMATTGATPDAIVAKTGTAPGGVPTPSAAPLTPAEYLPKLEEFYKRGEALYEASKSNKISDRDVNLRFDDFMKWANETGNWMNVNVSPGVTTRFATWHVDSNSGYKLAGRRSQDQNNKFSSLNVVLPQLLENLRIIIASQGVESSKTGANASN